MPNDTPWKVKLIIYSTPTVYNLTVSRACFRHGQVRAIFGKWLRFRIMRKKPPKSVIRNGTIILVLCCVVTVLRASTRLIKPILGQISRQIYWTKKFHCRSLGPDCFGAEFYINTASEISPVLKYRFNKGVFPPVWGRSISCPIHKSGSVSDPCNFRGIALINTMYKLFSIILDKRLYAWAEENGKLDEAQAGFRSGYYVVNTIFSLSAMVQKYLSRRGGRFYCLYVDFQKAFNKIQHQKLFIS